MAFLRRLRVQNTVDRRKKSEGKGLKVQGIHERAKKCPNRRCPVNGERGTINGHLKYFVGNL
jgi:hypothetical protein